MQRRQLLSISATLFGTAVSASLSRAVLAGSSDAISLSHPGFSTSARQAVEHLCEMIIPATDTPGALEAGVADFVASVVFDWYSEAEKSAFFAGLQTLDDYCLQHEARQFAQASANGRTAALEEQARLASGHQPALAPAVLGGPQEDSQAPFFNRIKALVVLGYYTSEIGATQELIYMPVPGVYRGDVDFADIGRQWIY